VAINEVVAGMNILQRWFLKRVRQHAEPYFRAQGLLRTVKIHASLVWEPTATRIVVLAPHMDDEVIGCGGTLYRHIQKGAEVTVVYLTDGRYGSKQLSMLSGEDRRKYQAELIEIRKAEAQLAMNTLGIQKGIFLDAEETKLAASAEVYKQVQHILHAVRPDIVYLPFFWEAHPDHSATSQVLLAATDGTALQFECYGYEVWTPLFPNVLVDIQEVIDVKRQALQQYRSQLADNNYLHTALGLNAYRSILLLEEHSQFAEAFFVASHQDYRELHRAYVQGSQAKLRA
jgi:LmbE family N-acetylglucosaminyl deacetylase